MTKDTSPTSSAPGRAIENCPDLNMGNYDEVDVERLNDWAIRANDEIDRLHTQSEMRRAALLDEMQKAAQAVAQGDLITLRKPTTSAELLWLLKLAHLVISDVDKTLEETFAPAPQPTQPQAGAVPLADEYPALVCDYCGALTPDPWHSSGMLHGKMSKHIHSCDACAAREAARAQGTREQLTPERVKEIVRGAGYDQCGIPDTERAAFINGLRHGEREHGIKGSQHAE